MTEMEALTSTPEFKVIIENAYQNAYLDGQSDERKRCLSWIETLCPKTDITQQAYDVIREKIRSGK